ncbi:hypothetical protein CSA37_11045 [Candidatus Fermentibacteria bacterium]|nr:MAG: hypothetical protein CSA37_11045 [Candidatus Fermentibacteria bacterium]
MPGSSEGSENQQIKRIGLMGCKTKSRLIAVCGALFIVISLFFLGRSFIEGIHQAGGIGQLLNFDIPLFLGSMVLLAIHLMLAGLTWERVTTLSGGGIGFIRGFAIHFLSQVGKYIPGKVWAAMGKYSLSRYSGLTAAQVGQGLILETVFIVLGCLTATIPLMPFIAEKAGLAPAAGTVLAVIPAAILLMSVHPFFFRKLAVLAAKVMKSTGSLREFSFTEMICLYPIYLSLFVVLGVAFWVLALSFGLVMPFFPGVLIYPAAMGIGYLAIFAPGGLGARELTAVWFIHVLVPDCEPGLAELVTLVARLWITAGEVIALGFSFFLFGIKPSAFKTMFSGGRLPD